MCIRSPGIGDTWKTRNDARVLVQDQLSNGAFVAIVTNASHTDDRFPVGTRVTYQSGMGHVLCKGEEEDGKECSLHPLDLTSFVTCFDGDVPPVTGVMIDETNPGDGAGPSVMPDEEPAAQPEAAAPVTEQVGGGTSTEPVKAAEAQETPIPPHVQRVIDVLTRNAHQINGLVLAISAKPSQKLNLSENDRDDTDGLDLVTHSTAPLTSPVGAQMFYRHPENVGLAARLSHKLLNRPSLLGI